MSSLQEQAQSLADGTTRGIKAVQKVAAALRRAVVDMRRMRKSVDKLRKQKKAKAENSTGEPSNRIKNVLKGRTALSKAVDDTDPKILHKFKEVLNARPMRVIKDPGSDLCNGVADISRCYVIKKGRNIMKVLLRDEEQRAIFESTVNQFRTKFTSSASNKAVPLGAVGQLLVPNSYIFHLGGCVLHMVLNVEVGVLCSMRIIMEQTDVTSSVQESMRWLLPDDAQEIMLDSPEVDAIVGNDGEFKTAREQLKSTWIVANRQNTTYCGLESQGLGTIRVQLSGGRLILLALVEEVLAFYGESSIKAAVDQLASTDLKELPDQWAVPSLCAEYLKTGDFMYCPPGHICVEKALSDVSISIRREWKHICGCECLCSCAFVVLSATPTDPNE